MAPELPAEALQGGDRAVGRGADGRPVAIVGATLIDIMAGRAEADRCVVIEADRISQIGSLAGVALPEGTRVIDGRGLYLVPGLVDSHVHFSDPETFGPLLLANGVTLVRDMGMPNDVIVPLREAIASGRLLGPTIRTSGAILDGAPPLIPPISTPVATAQEATDAVRSQARAGVDFIKVYSRLDAEVFLSIVAEARGLGLKVAGHVPDSVRLEDAAAAGLGSCEHFFGFDKLLGELLGVPVQFAYHGMGADAHHLSRLPEIEPAALRASLLRLRGTDLAVCPTVVVFKAGMKASLFRSGTFTGREYVSNSLLDMWRTLWAGQTDLPDFIWRSWSCLVALLHETGIPLMVGTDLTTPGILPGFSIHDEMEIWQDAGIPALDILRSSTLVPVEFLGLSRDLGTIAEGKIASLILVRANPLTDVRNLRKIESVFVRGRYFSHTDLGQLVATATGSPPRPSDE